MKKRLIAILAVATLVLGAGYAASVKSSDEAVAVKRELPSVY